MRKTAHSDVFLYSYPGVYIIEGLLILFPPCLWFSSPRRIASRYKINDYIICSNIVKMCCSNQRLPFGTTKSVKSSKNSLFSSFLAFDFFPHLQTFDLFPPPTGGGGILNFIHPCYSFNHPFRFRESYICKIQRSLPNLID